LQSIRDGLRRDLIAAVVRRVVIVGLSDYHPIDTVNSGYRYG
jgi:hypothetical protein